jgi:hypothetical protein
MKRNSLILLWCLATVLGYISLSHAAGEKWREWTPLPGEVNIITPGPDVPSKLAKLSGIWQGNWTDMGQWGDPRFAGTVGRAVTIVVEQITASQANMIYSWGSWRNDTPGWFRADATVKEDKIVMVSPRGATTTLTTSDGKTAYAEWDSPGFGGFRANLKKVQ